MPINVKNSSLTSRKVVKLIAEFASDKKAFDISILDMRKVVNFCDYFVLCSGNTDRQVRAIADGIEDSLGDLGIKPSSKEGARDSRWILMDLGDIVIHIFEKQAREFYGLDYLWAEAKRID